MSTPADALLSINQYDAMYQMKLREWYPKLNEAKKEAYGAYKALEFIFMEPPIFVNDVNYTAKRIQATDRWNKAWQKWTQMYHDFSNTPLQPSLAEQVAMLQQQLVQLSNRLAEPVIPSSAPVDQNPK